MPTRATPRTVKPDLAGALKASLTPPAVAVLTKERETKGTWRYQEEGDDPILRTLYLPKRIVIELGDPDTIEVTIQAK